MTVTMTAIRNAGIGCILGEMRTCEHVQQINDRGEYYELYFHANRQMRVSKNDWRLEVSK